MEPGPLKCKNISPESDGHSSCSQPTGSLSAALLSVPPTEKARRPTIDDESLDLHTTFVELWEEAVSHYRQTLSLSPDEKLAFESQYAVISSDLFRDIANNWALFREGSKIGKLTAVKNRLERVVRVLHGQITTIDVMIGYPTQAVCSLTNLN
jgi:hypothetical protein